MTFNELVSKIDAVLGEAKASQAPASKPVLTVFDELPAQAPVAKTAAPVAKQAAKWLINIKPKSGHLHVQAKPNDGSENYGTADLTLPGHTLEFIKNLISAGGEKVRTSFAGSSTPYLAVEATDDLKGLVMPAPLPVVTLPVGFLYPLDGVEAKADADGGEEDDFEQETIETIDEPEDEDEESDCGG